MYQDSRVLGLRDRSRRICELLVSTMVVVLTSSCAEDLDAPRGPHLTAVDSITLEETDTLYLGRPVTLKIDPADGSFYVADVFANRVVRFDRSGQPLRTYGSRGSGPGEFVGVGESFVVDSVLYVADVNRRIVSWFNKQSASFLGERKLESYFKSASIYDGVVWMGSHNRLKGTSIVKWDQRTDSMHGLVPLPTEYVRSQPLAGIYNGSSVVVLEDTLLVGFQGSNRLFVADFHGTVLDTVAVPVRRRRGVPEDVVQRLEELSFPEMFSLSSVLFHLHSLPSGETALVHYDQKIDGSLITAAVYVSILSADRKRACVDRRVMESQDGQPLTALRGDTLFALEQRVAEERAVTLIKSYQVDSRGCVWDPVT